MALSRRTVLATLAALMPAPMASAQGWPTRPMTLVVPFAAGSTPDMMARLMADVMSVKLGQTVIVDNRPGAGGNTGTNVIAKAAPDGHMFGISIQGPLVTNPMLTKSMPYDAIKDLAPVSHIASQPGALVVPAGSEAKTVAAFAAKLKSDGDKVTYGSIGKGSVSHLSMALLASKLGVQPVHLPFAGSPPAIIALLRNDVQAAVLPLGAVGQQVKEGKLLLLAVTTAKRSSFFPNVPTLVESGFPGIEADAWTGFVAPGSIDPGLLAKLSNAVREAMTDPNVVEKLRAQYIEPVGTTPDVFAAMLAAERDRWAPVIAANGIVAE